MRKILEIIISRLKKENYTLDKNLTTLDILSLIIIRGLQIVRGFFRGLSFGKKNGLIFVGKRVKITHPWNILSGSNLIIDDNVSINALSKNKISFGNNVSIGKNTIIDCTGVISSLGEGLELGNNVGISPNCFFGIRGKVKLGKNTILGPFVSLHSENHVFDNINTPIRLQGTTRKGINIGENCWIGAKSTILDGVTIGNGVVVAAGSIVTKDIPNNVVVAGVPAKIIKNRI